MSTPKQRRQQQLSWWLKQVCGAHSATNFVLRNEPKLLTHKEHYRLQMLLQKVEGRLYNKLQHIK